MLKVITNFSARTEQYLQMCKCVQILYLLDLVVTLKQENIRQVNPITMIHNFICSSPVSLCVCVSVCVHARTCASALSILYHS